MSDAELKRRALAGISSAKSELLMVEGFDSSGLARNLYVIALTVEGAIMFDDHAELAGVCVEFCKKKERDVVVSN